MNWLASAPTTNLRIIASIGLLIVTGIFVMIRWTEPPAGWLMLLGASLALDVTQFHLKRKTTFPPERPKP